MGETIFLQKSVIDSNLLAQTKGQFTLTLFLFLLSFRTCCNSHVIICTVIMPFPIILFLILMLKHFRLFPGHHFWSLIPYFRPSHFRPFYIWASHFRPPHVLNSSHYGIIFGKALWHHFQSSKLLFFGH